MPSDEEEPYTPLRPYHFENYENYGSIQAPPISKLKLRSKRIKLWDTKSVSEITSSLESLVLSPSEVSVSEPFHTDIVQVADMSNAEVLNIIAEILRNCSSRNNDGMFYTFKYPNRSRPWNAYSEELHRIVLLKKKDKENLHTHMANSEDHSQDATKLFELLCILKELLLENCRVSKRSLYYSSRHNFKSQADCDKLIEDAACLVGCRRRNLPVYAEPQGKIGGMLKIIYKGHAYDCRQELGCLIPRDVDVIQANNLGAKFILVVEKRTVFDRLMDEKFYETLPCIILTGCGQPDLATKEMLRKIFLEFKLPTCVLTDCNPYGFLIFMTYLVGSMQMSYDSANLRTPNLLWIGILPSDLKRYDIPFSHVSNIPAKEMGMISDPIWYPHLKVDAHLNKEYIMMKQKKEKIEIEDLNGFGFSYFHKFYLPDKLGRLYKLSKGCAIKSVKVREMITMEALEIMVSLWDDTLTTYSLPSSCCESKDKEFIFMYVNNDLAQKLKDFNPLNQEAVDEILDKLTEGYSLDNERELARNVNWATSVAVCKAGACSIGIPLYRYIDGLVKEFGEVKSKFDMPTPSFNINNGVLCPKSLASQHLVILPSAADSFYEAICMVKNIYGKFKVSTDCQEAIDESEEPYTFSTKGVKNCAISLEKVISDLGYKEKVSIGVNIGASKFYKHNGTYHLNLIDENCEGSHEISGADLKQAYDKFLREFHFQTVEDPFHLDDRDYSSQLVNEFQHESVIMDFDFDTDFGRLLNRIEDKACNGLVLKVDQLGSVTKCIECVLMAKEKEWVTDMSSHDSCETSDPFIADLCVGLCLEKLKIGVSCITNECKICNRVCEIEDGKDVGIGRRLFE